MFQKKYVKWGMAMAILGMTGIIEAQTINKRWVRQNADNPRQAREAIRAANFIAQTSAMVVPDDDSGSAVRLSGALAPYRDAYINAAKAVGAPNVDIVSDPAALRTPKTCWETVAWDMTGNNAKALSDAVVQEVAKQGLPELDSMDLTLISGKKSVPYVMDTCVNLER